MVNLPHFRVPEVSKFGENTLKVGFPVKMCGNRVKSVKLVNFTDFAPLFGPSRPKLMTNFTTNLVVFWPKGVANSVSIHDLAW